MEASLLKMTVPGQRFGKTFAMHDGKGNAIRQRPFLVVDRFAMGEVIGI